MIPAEVELARLRLLLSRAYRTLHDGYVGGEWAQAVHQTADLSPSAAKEADEAEQVLRELAAVLGWPRSAAESYLVGGSWWQTQRATWQQALAGASREAP